MRQSNVELGKPQEPDFGKLITVRGQGAACFIGIVFAGVVSTCMLLAAVSMLISGRTYDRVGLVVLLAVSAGLFALTYYLIQVFRTKYEFREFGAIVRRSGRIVRSMAYADCERFVYTVTRQYVYGIYSGTSLALSLKAKGRSSIGWSGTHKQKPVGLSYTILGKGEFKGEDELDVVKLVIADEMADMWIDQLTQGVTINWHKQLELGATTAKILRGKRKGQVVPYAALDRVAMNNGILSIWHVGDEKSCVNVGMNNENFWPGFAVLQRQWAAISTGDNDRELGDIPLEPPAR